MGETCKYFHFRQVPQNGYPFETKPVPIFSNRFASQGWREWYSNKKNNPTHPLSDDVTFAKR